MSIVRVFNRLRTVSGQNIFNIRFNGGRALRLVCREVYREIEINTNGFEGTFAPKWRHTKYSSRFIVMEG